MGKIFSGEIISMATNSKPLAITEVVLRDAHQSILATRFRIEDYVASLCKTR